MDSSKDPGNPALHKPSRREVLRLGAACVLGAGVSGTALWWRRRERGQRANVFIGKAPSYKCDLAAVIRDGLTALGITARDVRGKCVLLKPNLVESALQAPHINTHPAVVVAAVEAFRQMNAGEVLVGEGPGHRRDTWLVLEESGMMQALAAADARFVDLNRDDFVTVPNCGARTNLPVFHVSQTVRRADVIVSMPKLKTHHWVGVTCAMKNLFGTMPGVVYGWPKNPLHWAGIGNCILDINAAIRPALAIVDAVVGMEGDGPIMGTPKSVGALVMGRNLPAVDSTCVRLMGLDPQRVRYLARASGWLGPVQAHNIAQRGEAITALRTRFEGPNAAHLAKLFDA